MPRRASVAASSPDTVARTHADTSVAKTVIPKTLFVAQDPPRDCRSTLPYVLWGGFIGALFGFARYDSGTDVDFAPWLSIPFVVTPYILGGMLVGHLVAPC